jgi:predicted nucleic acid-binding protein
MNTIDTDIIVALLKGTPQAIQKITSIEEKGYINSFFEFFRGECIEIH